MIERIDPPELGRPSGFSHAVVADAGAYMAALRDRFGLDVPEAEALWPALCERHEAYLAARAARRSAEAPVT